ncbi:MAG TPA: hypothetical protein DEO40_02205, partial [Treponema sp.]|nr:hypothetical protein [Treponema sp.]HCA19473.1 hypothetical protein [Treponema sp.]
MKRAIHFGLHYYNMRGFSFSYINQKKKSKKNPPRKKPQGKSIRTSNHPGKSYGSLGLTKKFV